MSIGMEDRVWHQHVLSSPCVVTIITVSTEEIEGGVDMPCAATHCCCYGHQLWGLEGEGSCR